MDKPYQITLDPFVFDNMELAMDGDDLYFIEEIIEESDLIYRDKKDPAKFFSLAYFVEIEEHEHI